MRPPTRLCVDIVHDRRRKQTQLQSQPPSTSSSPSPPTLQPGNPITRLLAGRQAYCDLMCVHFVEQTRDEKIQASLPNFSVPLSPPSSLTDSFSLQVKNKKTKTKNRIKLIIIHLKFFIRNNELTI